MTHRNVVCTCLVILLILSLSVPVRADEHYTVSERAEPPELQADKALVYFVVEPSDRLQIQKLYVDKHPVGFLPEGSYTATLVKPGIRLIWGPQWMGEQSGEWFEFKAGKHYLLETTASAQGWLLRHPARIVAVEKSEKLKYVEVTEVGLQKLHRNLDAKYEEARQHAGDPTPVTLPISFRIKVEVSKPGSKKQGASGTLTIEETRIRFASKKANKLSFDIAIEDVEGVDLVKAIMPPNASEMISFSVLVTKSHGSVVIGGKASMESFRFYNRRFQAIMKALESCSSCSGVQG
jgi:hypothetical protein